MAGRVDDTTDTPPFPGGEFAQLSVRSGGQKIRTVPIRGRVRVGRAGENELVLDDGDVAPHHASIYPLDGSFFLRSEGTATTRINGVRLIGRRRLHNGDRIGVGDVVIVYSAAHAADADAKEVEDEEAALALLKVLRSTLPAPKVARSRRLPWQGNRQGEGQERTRKPVVVPTPAGVLVLVAIAAIVVYLIAPGSFQPRHTDKRLTPVIIASGANAALPSATQPGRIPAGEQAASATPAEGAATPDDLASFLAEAETLTLRSQFDAAIERYQLLAERVPRDARVEAGWALALLLDGDVEQATVHAEAGTQIDPDSARAWSVLARAYVAQDKASAALSAGRKAVALAGAGDAARAHAVLAEAYLLGGLLPQAVDQAEMAMSPASPPADAYSIRGRLYLLADDDAAAAVEALRRAAELEPGLWTRHQELGLLLLDLEQYRPATQALTEAMVLAYKPATYTALGSAHYHLGEYDQAKSYLEQSLSLGARDVETYALLAVMNAAQGRCDDARVYYSDVFERDATHPMAQQAQEMCEQGAIPVQTGGVETSTPGASRTPDVPTSTPDATAAPRLAGWIAFSTWNRALGHYDTYVARPDGTGRHLVAAQMHQPAFRPDGEWLALNGERPLHMNIHIVRADGGEQIEISSYLEDRLPSWSVDGKALIYSSTRHPDRQPRLYIVDEVPVDGRRGQDRPVRANLYEVLGDYPTWLPDGRIVYTGCDWSSGATQCGLMAISSEPGAQTLEVLTEYPGDTAAAAGPGGQIAFMSDRDGNWDVYVLAGDGSLRRLTQHPANDGLPAWSPDGEQVAFVSDRDGTWAVWVVRADGSGVRKLFDLGEGGLAVDWQHESISWGP